MDDPIRKHGMSLHILVVTAITAIAWMAVSVGPVHATTPGENGRIAFRRYFDDAHTRGAIFTIRPNGTGLIQVTHRGKVAYDHQPVWSPNGKWIAFHRVEEGKPSRIFKVRPDGTDLTLLSLDPNSGEDGYPAWSPNGKRIAFHRFNDSTGLDAYFVMRADGTHVRQIPGTGHYEGLGIARYAPDGSHLAFGASTEKGSAAFTIRLDGTHTRRVTPWAFDGGAYDWSPDGRWLLVESHADGSWQRNVFLVHPNGTDLHAVTHTYTGGASNWGGLAFSPDGTMIAAAHTGVGKVNPDIWVMRLDGSGLRDLTSSLIYDSAPGWGSRAT